VAALATVVLPMAALPVWAIAVAYAVAGTVWLAHWLTFRSALAAAFARTAFAGVAYWALVALILGAHSAAEAAFWDRLFLPAAALAILGLIEGAAALSATGGARLVTGVRALSWLALGAGVGLAVDPATSTWFPMHRVPDGFWLASGHVAQGLARVALVIGAALVLLALFVRGIARGRRDLAWYAAAVVAAVPLGLNDVLWVQRHRTPFPETWLIGLFVLVMMVRALWAEVRATNDQLDHDPSTGAKSRRYGDWYGRRALALGPAGFVYADLDNLKAVNDALGHGAGDRLLLEAVRRLGAQCRGADRVVRMGGDELLVILPGCAEDEGEALITRLRAAVAGTPVALADGVRVPVEMSLGFGWGGRGTALEMAVARADRAMYEDKRQRRRSPAPTAVATARRRYRRPERPPANCGRAPVTARRTAGVPPAWRGTSCGRPRPAPPASRRPAPASARRHR
jgi:diguanylate cyclase (GGDEF)-like protein